MEENSIRYAILDSLVIAKRNLLRTMRLPQLVVFSSIQPVMFLLLFNYVFGGAVSGPLTGEKYINFLLPGILIQTSIFGSIQTGVGLAEDMQKGVVDRFRSLPMSRVAHVAGRIMADAVRNVFVIILMSAVGFLLGFRFQNGVGFALLAVVLAVFFAFAFSWVSALFGLLAKDSETAQVAGFLWTFPLSFASSIFVPVESMPGWLQVFSRNQPVTHAVNAMRTLLIEGDVSSVYKTIAWVVGIVLVVSPIAIYKYRKAS